MTPTQRAALLDRAAELCLAITGRDPHAPGVLDVDYLRIVRALFRQHEESSGERVCEGCLEASTDCECAITAEVEAQQANEQAQHLLGAVGELAVENAALLVLLSSIVDAVGPHDPIRGSYEYRLARQHVEAQRKAGNVPTVEA